MPSGAIAGTDADRSASGIECMSAQDCETLLSGTTTTGRLAFQSTSGQQLLPVNFVFRRGRVYFKTSPQSTLFELAAGCDDVAFEIDYPDRLSQRGWSVLVKGKTREVSAAEVDLTPDAVHPWAPRVPRPWAPGVREVMVELEPDQITGRRIRDRS